MEFENLLEKHTFTLPTSKKALILRPILVKEEKILLMQKGNENKNFLNAILQVIENCTINNEIKWKEMSYNDFSYAFVKLREISRDDIVSISLLCENKECEHNEKEIIKNFNIKDILKIENENNKYSKILKINDTYSIKLKEMSLNFILSLYEKYSEKELEEMDPFIINIDMIVEHTESIITEKDKIIEKNKIKDFIDLLKMKDIINIYKWFSNEPQIKVETKWICNKCKTENIFQEVDVINFFDIF